jgi:molybdenum cofactor biosynthesis enzyme MoaA
MISEEQKNEWRREGISEKEIQDRIAKDYLEGRKLKPYPAVSTGIIHNRDIVLNCTNNCCYKCPFCPLKYKGTEEIDLKVFEKFLKDAKFRGYGGVSLTGGEPCLHSQFKKLVRLIAKNGFYFTFVSNGRFWEDYKFCLKYKPHFDACCFSLDGLKEIHNSFRGAGAFDKVMEALEFFSGKIPVIIKMEVNNRNYKEIPKMIELSRKFEGVDLEIFPVIFVNEFLLNEEQVCEIEKMIKDNKEFITGKNKIILGSMRPSDQIDCGSLLDKDIVIYPDGSVCLCCNEFGDGLPFANIKTDDILTILERKKSISRNVIRKMHSFLFDTNRQFVAKDICALCRSVRGLPI